MPLPHIIITNKRKWIGLTKRQGELFNFYQNKKNWRPPTIRTMKNYMKVNSNQTILDMLKILKRKKAL
jgi:SOS-response transcriptional repressor LexA